jgi:hypothetical protein
MSHLRQTALIAAALAGCAESKSAATPSNQVTPTPSSPAGCSKDSMANDVMTFRETTNPTLSDHQVGISNIFERELADANGVKAQRLSASLTIFDPATKQSRKEIVAADSVVTIGPDRYCVVSVDEGKNQPGSISIRKLAH